MKSIFTITMNYQRALAQAGALDRAAGNLRRIANNNVGGAKARIHSGWKGDNGDAAALKADTLQGKILASADSLSRTAETVRRVARNTYEAERRAWEIARRRTY